MRFLTPVNGQVEACQFHGRIMLESSLYWRKQVPNFLVKSWTCIFWASLAEFVHFQILAFCCCYFCRGVRHVWCIIGAAWLRNCGKGSVLWRMPFYCGAESRPVFYCGGAICHCDFVSLFVWRAWMFRCSTLGAFSVTSKIRMFKCHRCAYRILYNFNAAIFCFLHPRVNLVCVVFWCFASQTLLAWTFHGFCCHTYSWKVAPRTGTSDI